MTTQKGNRMRPLSRLVLFVASVTLLIAFEASADLPTDISCRYSVTRQSRQTTGTRLDGARHRFTVTLDETLGLGESCTITHNACGSAFIPKDQVPNADDRNCIDFRAIGTSTVGAGDSEITPRTQSRVLAEFTRGSNRGRQITYAATASCTDGTDTVEVSCNPRARKLSVNRAPGASVNRVIRQMAKNFDG